jgi:lauroyl/myristoyl acyltransferase
MSIAATRDAAPPLPPDVPTTPEPSRLRRLLGPLYVTGIFWFRVHRWGVRNLPSWAVGPAIVLFTAFFTVALRQARKAVAANLEAVLGPCGWWRRQARIARTFWNFAWCLTERYERLSTDHRFLVGAEGLDHWRDLNASGEGFLLVTAHLGSWEVGSMLPASRDARRVHVVREAEADPRAQRFIQELLEKQSAGGLYTTHFAEDPQLGMSLLDALRHGEIVALQGDRPRTGGRSVETRLFGRPFQVPLGPAALARAAEVPILPVFVFRDGRRRYRCSIRTPIRVAHTAGRQKDVEEALQRFAAELESAVAERPYQWFSFKDVWTRDRATC